MSYEQQLSSAAVAECTFEEREKREGNHPSTHMPPAARHSDGISLGRGPKVKARFRDYMARPTRDTAGSASPGGSLPSGNTTSIRWFCRHCGVIGCKSFYDRRRRAQPDPLCPPRTLAWVVRSGAPTPLFDPHGGRPGAALGGAVLRTLAHIYRMMLLFSGAGLSRGRFLRFFLCVTFR